ncbi:MAG: NUDIX hydrolase [Anaerolineales bacterium]
MKLATLVYIRKDGKTLMVYRNKKKNDVHQGKWNGLGGKFEAGETPEECAKREVLEESGLTVKNLELKGFLSFPQFANNEDWYAFVFIASDFEGELIDSPEGKLAWIENQQLLSLPLWEGDRIFLPWLEQKGFFSAKFVYNDGQLVQYHAEHYPAMGNID